MIASWFGLDRGVDVWDCVVITTRLKDTGDKDVKDDTTLSTSIIYLHHTRNSAITTNNISMHIVMTRKCYI